MVRHSFTGFVISLLNILSLLKNLDCLPFLSIYPASLYQMSIFSFPCFDFFAITFGKGQAMDTSPNKIVNFLCLLPINFAMLLVNIA